MNFRSLRFDFEGTVYPKKRNVKSFYLLNIGYEGICKEIRK